MARVVARVAKRGPNQQQIVTIIFVVAFPAAAKWPNDGCYWLLLLNGNWRKPVVLVWAIDSGPVPVGQVSRLSTGGGGWLVSVWPFGSGERLCVSLLVPDEDTRIHETGAASQRDGSPVPLT